MTSFLQKAFLFMMSLSPLALRVYAFPDGYGLISAPSCHNMANHVSNVFKARINQRLLRPFRLLRRDYDYELFQASFYPLNY